MATYKLSKGKFFSGLRIAPLFFKKSLNFRAYFWESCLYVLPNKYDQINKLYGMSQGMHHVNSARFGWRCTDGDKIEILAYCYVDKKEINKSLIKIKPEQQVFCYLRINKNSYDFKVVAQDGTSSIVTVNKTKNCQIGYKLFPYFGGKFPAPHDMRIDIKEI
jgi:hypothetical protein